MQAESKWREFISKPILVVFWYSAALLLVNKCSKFEFKPEMIWTTNRQQEQEDNEEEEENDKVNNHFRFQW